MSIFEIARREILKAVDTIAEQDPDCAAYLREHLVFDMEAETVTYTGNPDVIRLNPVLCGG